MANQPSLSILQYNVRKNKKGVMIFLLADDRIRDYDILAIQEPWRNCVVSTSYNPFNSGFHLAYAKSKDTRSCFYINKKLDLNA